MKKCNKIWCKSIFLLFCFGMSSVFAEDKTLSLEECLKIAFEKNRRLDISKVQVQIAKNRYEQVLSSFYPLISAKLGGFYINKGPQFKNPAINIALDPQFVDLQATAIAQSQLSLQGVTAATVGQDAYLAQLNATKGMITSNISGIQVDEQVSDITSKWTGTGSLDLVYPLYTGGKRRAYKKIQSVGVDNAQIANEQVMMEVVFDVKRLYYLSVLAKELHQIVSDLIEEMNVSLELIEKMYKTDKDLEISKADYLKHKIAVEQIKLIKLQIEKNRRDLAKALAFIIGIEGDDNVLPKSMELAEFAMLSLNLNNIQIEKKIISFNPDWKTLENALIMQGENIKVSQGDYYPTLALVGSLGFLENNKDTGNVYNIDERNYTVGLALEIPLFNGFLTKKKITEKRLEMQALNSQALLVKEAIRMKVVNLLNQISSLSNEMELEELSLKLSLDLVDAETMAYNIDKKKWEDLLNAQVYRSFINAQLLIMRFERLIVQGELNKLIGNEILSNNEK